MCVILCITIEIISTTSDDVPTDPTAITINNSKI